jgi:hypothetical protein
LRAGRRQPEESDERQTAAPWASAPVLAARRVRARHVAPVRRDKPPVQLDYAAVARQLAAARERDCAAAQRRPPAPFSEEPSDSGSSQSTSSTSDSDSPRQRLQLQLVDLKAIIRVMARGLRACDAAHMALRLEVGNQKVANPAALAQLRADIQEQQRRMNERVGVLEAVLSGAVVAEGGRSLDPGSSAAPSQFKPQPSRLGRASASVRATTAPTSRRVRWAPAVEATGDAKGTGAMSSIRAAAAADFAHTDAEDEELPGGPSFPSVQELRDAASASLPPELRLAGEEPSGPGPALSAAAWRLAGAVEPPRPANAAPAPSAQRRASAARLEHSLSLREHAALPAA